MAKIIQTADLLPDSALTRNESDYKLIKSWLILDSNTGELRWLYPPRRGVSALSIAGTLNGNGYIRITIPGLGRYYAHQIVWLLTYKKWPQFEIDHIDHNRANNRPNNLRDVNRTTNNFNRELISNNNSGYLNIYPTPSGKYYVRIGRRYFGTFSTLKTAIEARDKVKNG